jgi:Zn-dependent metalloprotease
LKSANRNIKLAIVLALTCISVLLNAQYQKQVIEQELNPFAERMANVMFPKNITINNETSFQSYLFSILSNLINCTLKPEYQKSSPYGEHYLFLQQLSNIYIYNSWIKINTDKNGKVLSLYDNSYKTSDWDLALLDKKINRLRTSDADLVFENSFSDEKKILTKEINIAVIDNQPDAYWKYRILHNVSSFREYLVNANHEILLSVDLNSYSSDTIGQALVFLPDPITRAMKYYNPPFVDNNNGFNPSLDSQRVLKNINITYQSGIFYLQNNYVEIAEFDLPNAAPVNSIIPQFFYNRSDSGFEDVNALYHITEFQKYIQSLDFSLSNYQISIDAHAMNGDDNSLFSPSTNPPRLYFGTGGVEDAEDADVIVHEYGHALSNDANNSNIGSERRALDEGLCDYFATSYSKAIDTFRWADMFTWDGHNEYWEGRTAATSKIYPDDLTSSIHANGEIWSSALMKIWDAIGKEATDKLMLQTLYGLSPNMSFTDAAKEFFMADTLIYNGSHYCEIYYAFLQHGLTDTVQDNVCDGLDKTLLVDAGNDVNVCPGDSIVIGNNIAAINLTYFWRSSDNSFSEYNPNIKVAPLETTQYIVKVSTDLGTYNTDTVNVTVNECDIAVFNSQGFFDGNSALRIYIPPSQQHAIIRLFDVNGKMLLEKKNLNSTSCYLNSEPFSSGIYFLSVLNSKKPVTFKLLKQ